MKKENKKKYIELKIFVVLLDEEIMAISTSDPRENDMGHNLTLLTMAVAKIHNKKFAIKELKIKIPL